MLVQKLSINIDKVVLTSQKLVVILITLMKLVERIIKQALLLNMFPLHSPDLGRGIVKTRT
jgi:hypothetical protein